MMAITRAGLAQKHPVVVKMKQRLNACVSMISRGVIFVRVAHFLHPVDEPVLP